MRLNKIIGMSAGIIGIFLGVAIVIAAIMDIDVPKLIWVVFGVVCLVNAVINYKKNKKR